MRPITTVIFDMDGLMLDTQRIALRAWQMAFTERGYDLPKELYLMAVGRTVRNTVALFRQTFAPTFPMNEVYARRQALMQELIESEGIPVKPGLLDLLDLVDDLGLAKAVATSTVRQRALERLSSAGVLDRFSTVVCGDDAQNGKPAPDIFLLAAQRLEVTATHCLVLEDSEAGIEAAHAAGMTSIMIPDLKQPAPEIAALTRAVLPSLNEVGPLLRELVGDTVAAREP